MNMGFKLAIVRSTKSKCNATILKRGVPIHASYDHYPNDGLTQTSAISCGWEARRALPMPWTSHHARQLLRETRAARRRAENQGGLYNVPVQYVPVPYSIEYCTSIGTVHCTVRLADSAVDLIHYEQSRTNCVRTAHSVSTENELISRTYS